LPRARGLDVFRADFEDFFKIHADVGEFALQQHYDVFVVLAFLACGGSACASLCSALDRL
jgi:hypothetical protein